MSGEKRLNEEFLAARDRRRQRPNDYPFRRGQVNESVDTGAGQEL